MHNLKIVIFVCSPLLQKIKLAEEEAKAQKMLDDIQRRKAQFNKSNYR